MYPLYVISSRMEFIIGKITVKVITTTIGISENRGITTKKGDMTAMLEANSFLFNDPFGLFGNFFRNYLTGGYRTLLDILVYIL